jgi:hypothetical protein
MPTINLNDKNLLDGLEETKEEIADFDERIQMLENEIPGSLRTLTDVNFSLGPSED